MFTILAEQHSARRGQLHTAHGIIETPFFMPIATKGAVQYLQNDNLAKIGNQILLANTYHLYLRPGIETLNHFGGLHNLMNWHKPILTDSGGFQVFSLAKLNTVSDAGVTFNSHIDGAKLEFTPELSMQIQQAIGADIWMCFDYFPGYPATHLVAQESVIRTTLWAQRCYDYWSAHTVDSEHQLFGIVQGSSYTDLRLQSAKELCAIPFSGYAVGGLAVGEPAEVMYQILEATVPALPKHKPRYLMGVGQPEQILEAVKRGIDMFDCVLPTRNARHGQLYIHQPEQPLVDSTLAEVHYDKIIIKNSEYRLSDEPIDPQCTCATCTSGYTRGYIRHLFSVNDPLAKQLATIHNVSFYIELMRSIRDSFTT